MDTGGGIRARRSPGGSYGASDLYAREHRRSGYPCSRPAPGRTAVGSGSAEDAQDVVMFRGVKWVPPGANSDGAGRSQRMLAQSASSDVGRTEGDEDCSFTAITSSSTRHASSAAKDVQSEVLVTSMDSKYLQCASPSPVGFSCYARSIRL